jgi:tetraacyldisaccharide 4'-kinase
LSILSGLYGRVTSLRRAWYTRHPDRQRRLDRPVISVGNLVAGGSGKTPVVAALAALLRDNGERPAILSRGYGRRQAADGVVVVSSGSELLADAEQSGDEPYMLARLLPAVPVLVSPDRYLAGRLAERRFGCSLHILDDGFQHLQLARDVDVVVMSRADLDEKLLPSGRLREPIDVVRLADAVLVAGSDEDAGAIGRYVISLFATHGRVPNIVRVVPEYGAPRLVGSGEPASGKRVIAVAGIARPERFSAALRTLGYDVAREMRFRDHHWFTSRDIEKIERTALEAGADLVITTEKDAARLDGVEWAYLPMTVSMEPREAFAVWLHRRLHMARGQRGEAA